MIRIKILYVAAECKPFSKMGGVADVAGELPLALKAQGVDITIVTPLYAGISKEHLVKNREYRVQFEGKKRPVTIWSGNLEDVPVLFVQNDEYLSKGPYVHSAEFPYKDDGKRFSFMSKAILPMITDDVDIVHGNDWMTGYLFGMMTLEQKPQKRVLTVHNIGYQGNMWIPHIDGWEISTLLEDIRTKDYFKDPHQDWNNVNPMRLALELSHMVNAVSPTYAKEILEPENPERYFEGGKGLETACKALSEQGKLVGILNGFNYEFDPTEKRFQDNLHQKEDAKRGLSGYFKKPETVLLGFVGRAVEQKFMLLTEKLDGKPVLEHILDIPDVNLAILATGLDKYEKFIGNLSTQRFEGLLEYPALLEQSRRTNYASFTAFDRAMAMIINSASDIFLMPSLYEPCGITQLESMCSATPPLVRWTGGLCDTVVDHSQKEGTGFGFDGDIKDEVLRNLIQTVIKAKDVWGNKEKFQQLQRNAFFKRFTWDDAAKKYIEMYQNALKDND